jgi:hypothetical protein
MASRLLVITLGTSETVNQPPTHACLSVAALESLILMTGL